MPAISILIPVANGSEFLFESLNSVLEQTFTDWECLVILNGEGLLGPAEAVAAAFDTPQIRIIRSDAHTKVDALNDAMNYATCEWIALLDVDDRWYPTKLAEQMAALQGPAKDAAVIGTLTHYFGEYNGIPQLPVGWIPPTILASLNPLTNSSVLIRRHYAQWSYPPTHPSSLEDYHLWFQIVAAGGRLYNLPKMLTAHRIHVASAFNSRNESPVSLQQWWLCREQKK